MALDRFVAINSISNYLYSRFCSISNRERSKLIIGLTNEQQTNERTYVRTNEKRKREEGRKRKYEKTKKNKLEASRNESYRKKIDWLIQYSYSNNFDIYESAFCRPVKEREGERDMTKLTKGTNIHTYISSDILGIVRRNQVTKEPIPSNWFVQHFNFLNSVRGSKVHP